MIIAWFASWGCGWCGCHQPLPCDRDWYGDQHGAAATCNNHQPSATQNHNPCWYSWSDSDQRFHHVSDLNSLRQGHLWLRILLFILDQDGPAAQLRPPFQDNYWRVARMFTNPWIWNHPLQALLIPRYPSCIQSQQLCFRSNFYGFAYSCVKISGEPQGSPVRRTKPCLGGWQWRYFWVDRPSHVYFLGMEEELISLRTSISVSARYLRLVMSWLGCFFFSSNLPVSEISSCSPFSMCLFLIRREITCHWQRVEPTNDFPAAQFIAQLWFAYFHSVFLSDLANKNHQLVF